MFFFNKKWNLILMFKTLVPNKGFRRPIKEITFYLQDLRNL
jgi:hypothetical protein